MDDMRKEVHDLKTSLHFSQKEVDELKETGKELKNKEARTAQQNGVWNSLNNEWDFCT